MSDDYKVHDLAVHVEKLFDVLQREIVIARKSFSVEMSTLRKDIQHSLDELAERLPEEKEKDELSQAKDALKQYLFSLLKD